ncbi:piggyBac transposable element-derived protein 4-like [Dendropsophus ebraccatus]|uniref:piggyBac transposable element-derived protein 4-like n=1 Tax=Dendropsophus ebraccatus TaxID=150705 RepID=UPI0038312F1D
MLCSGSGSETDTASDPEFFPDSDASGSSSEESVPARPRMAPAAAVEVSQPGPSRVPRERGVNRASSVPVSFWDPATSFSPQIPPFTATPGINRDVSNFYPVDFFYLFVGDEVLGLIVEQTNLYARQYITQKPTCTYATSWRPTSVAEIKKFLGLTLLMGVVKKPSIRSYWSVRATHSTPVFAAIMSRTRYETLMRFMHFNDKAQCPPRNDPNFDRLYKLRPLLSLLQQTFLTVYTPDKQLAVDESLMNFKGRLSFRQFTPSKRARYGVKVYKVCESPTGYTCNFFIYEGRDRQLNPPDCPDTVGVSGKIVWELMVPFLHKGYHLYTDNFYSSVPLYKLLHAANTGACGTVRKSRVGLPPELLSRRVERGASFALASENLLAVKWHDRKQVFMITTLHADTSVVVRGRGATTDSTKPACVWEYNRFMGGVDLSDQALQPYLVKRKTRAWYKKVAVYLIQTATYNAFVVFQKAQGGAHILTISGGGD